MIILLRPWAMSSSGTGTTKGFDSYSPASMKTRPSPPARPDPVCPVAAAPKELEAEPVRRFVPPPCLRGRSNPQARATERLRYRCREEAARARRGAGDWPAAPMARAREDSHGDMGRIPIEACGPRTGK